MRQGEVIATGWAHPCAMHLRLVSMHAEQHCLRRVDLDDVAGATAYIATISAKSGNLTTARPCLDCVRMLEQAGVLRVCYTVPGGMATLAGMAVPPTEELDLATCMDEDFRDYKIKTRH